MRSTFVGVVLKSAIGQCYSWHVFTVHPTSQVCSDATHCVSYFLEDRTWHQCINYPNQTSGVEKISVGQVDILRNGRQHALFEKRLVIIRPYDVVP